MTEGITVHDGLRNYREGSTSWVVSVMDDVLHDSVLNERRFKERMEQILAALVEKVAIQFFADHQDWVNEVFSVQGLRIALLDEMRYRVERTINDASTQAAAAPQ